MIKEELINEYISKHVFPQFREVKHPIYTCDRYFAIGLNDDDRVACISAFDNSLLTITPFTWGSVKDMFSLCEEETIIILTRWFRKNVPLLSFEGIVLLTYP